MARLATLNIMLRNSRAFGMMLGLVLCWGSMVAGGYTMAVTITVVDEDGLHVPDAAITIGLE